MRIEHKVFYLIRYIRAHVGLGEDGKHNRASHSKRTFKIYEPAYFTWYSHDPEVRILFQAGGRSIFHLHGMWSGWRLPRCCPWVSEFFAMSCSGQ
jgi:hypothetical protein